MKKLIFLLALSLSVVSCRTYKSQNPDYKPLKEFGTDTLAYYRYNFKEHKDFYIGERFSVLLNDLIDYNPKVIPDLRYLKSLRGSFVIGTGIYIEPEKYRNERIKCSHDKNLIRA